MGMTVVVIRFRLERHVADDFLSVTVVFAFNLNRDEIGRAHV